MWTERRGWYAYSVAKAADADRFVHLFGLEVRAVAMFPFTITVSALAQIPVLPMVGAVAGHTGRMWELLAGFAWLGSPATMGLFAVVGERYLVGAAPLMAPFVAFGGVLLAGMAARRHGTRDTVLGSPVIWTAAVGAALLVQPGSVAQFMLLTAVIGLIMGGTQALSRSLFTRLVPPRREAEYFALTLRWTGSHRAALVSLTVFYVLGLASLLAVRVPSDRARGTAQGLAARTVPVRAQPDGVAR
ncbi:MFS transporter [Spirillospora sp. CA-294931]|uniref:MFS transporter n=1 Tax=Spirillospora sp. CA-294931 TaxID=3240042 RepID=UPI003D8A2D3D